MSADLWDSGGGRNKESTSNSDKIYFRIMVGHESEVLKPKLANGHTHRWTVFVKGADGGELDCSVVQKVVFLLHNDFPNPKRVIKTPPFEVTETGYAGFTIPIFVHFVGCKQECCLEYNMDLFLNSPAVHKVNKTLEVKNPKPELKAKLFAMGGDTNKKSQSAPQSKGAMSKFEALFGPTLAPPLQPKPKSPKKDKDKTSSNHVTNAQGQRMRAPTKGSKIDDKTASSVSNSLRSPSSDRPPSAQKDPPPIVRVRTPSSTSSLSPQPLPHSSNRDSAADSTSEGESAAKSRKEKRKKSPGSTKGGGREKQRKKDDGTTSPEPKTSGLLNPELLRHLVKAVGGADSDVESIVSSRPSMPRSESPIFQTEGSPEPQPSTSKVGGKEFEEIRRDEEKKRKKDEKKKDLKKEEERKELKKEEERKEKREEVSSAKKKKKKEKDRERISEDEEEIEREKKRKKKKQKRDRSDCESEKSPKQTPTKKIKPNIDSDDRLSSSASSPLREAKTKKAGEGKAVKKEAKTSAERLMLEPLKIEVKTDQSLPKTKGGELNKKMEDDTMARPKNSHNFKAPPTGGGTVVENGYPLDHQVATTSSSTTDSDNSTPNSTSESNVGRLRRLQAKIMKMDRPEVAAKLAEIVRTNASYDVRERQFVEFDLCALSATVIDEMYKCFESNT